MRRSRGVLLLATVACAASVLAQTGTALLLGSVQDAGGAAIPHAQVVLLNAQNGMERTVRTNRAGEYSLPEVAPGRYMVRISSQGFGTVTEMGLIVSVGERRTLNARLQPDTVTAQVTVIAEGNTVETTASALSATTDRQEIQALPLNGRDTVQLALLTPGVAPSRRANDSQGNGRQVSISGRRPNQVAFVLDGSDVNDAYNNTPASAAGVLLGVDAVAEFRVLTSGYSAEYGRSGGGVITQLTRSGDNALHGSAFEFIRNSAADAKNYFDSPAQRIPLFQRNQFGGSAGGPLRRDRLFGFGTYESLRQRLGVTSIAVVPNATSRATAVPAVQPYLALVPLPNATVYTDGTGQYVSAANNTAREDLAVARVDAALSAKTQAFVRYRFDTSQVVTPDSLLLSDNRNNSTDHFTTFGLTDTLTSNLVNALRLSGNYSYFTLNFDYLKNIPASLSFVPGQPFGEVSITGLAQIGPQRFGPTLNALSLFQGTDQITWNVGRHLLTFGANEEQILFPQQAPQSQNGFYLFNSLGTFLAGTPSSVEVALPGSIARRHWRQHMDAAWLTDTYRATNHLALTAGLRYERESVPTEKNGLSSMLQNPLLDAASTVGPLYANPTNKNFAPRVGFAYAPGTEGRLSLRSSFGIYFDPLWTDFYLNAGSRQPPFFTVGTLAVPTFPNPQITPANFLVGRIDTLQYHAASPYTMQWNASLQQELLQGLILTVAYDANRGVHDTRAVDANQALPQFVNGRKFFPVNSVVRNPNFTSLREKETNGLSSYNGLIATLDYHARSFQARGSYTWSHDIDTGSLVTAQGSENDITEDPDSLQAEKGNSNYDLRHYVTAYAVWSAPQFCRSAVLCGAWQTNVVANFSSGAPFSVLVSYDSARARFGTGPSPERPDLVPGRSPNPITGGANHYFDPSGFSLPAPGFYGTLPRNTLVGPGLASIDFALNKTVNLTESLRLQLRTELFNVPNHGNLAIPSQRNVFSPAGPVSSAGLITQTLTSSRQLQLAARLEF